MSSEMTDEEYEYTHEMHTRDLRKKDIATLSLSEAKIRIFYDEKDLKTARMLLKEKDNKIKKLETKLESLLQSLRADKDIDEEFE